MSNQLMKCGCVAHGKNAQTMQPWCVTHDCEEPAEALPSLEGRSATCCYGHHAKVPSKWDLAFFRYRPESTEDEYYCGCYGWD